MVESGKDERRQIVKHLINLRKQRGLRIQGVAEMSGGLIDNTTLSRIESGERGLTLKSAYALATVYGVSLNDLCSLAYGSKGEIVEAEGLVDLSDREIDLIRRIRQIPIDPRNDIMSFISKMSKALKKEN